MPRFSSGDEEDVPILVGIGKDGSLGAGAWDWTCHAFVPPLVLV